MYDFHGTAVFQSKILNQLNKKDVQKWIVY